MILRISVRKTRQSLDNKQIRDWNNANNKTINHNT
jgi:hypothetical protein